MVDLQGAACRARRLPPLRLRSPPSVFSARFDTLFHGNHVDLPWPEGLYPFAEQMACLRRGKRAGDYD